MNKTVAYILGALLVIVGFAVAVHELWPKVTVETHTIPPIVTKRETVAVAPKWLQDSVRYWKSKRVLSDTVTLVKSSELITRTTVHDTVYPKLWTIVSYSQKDTNALVRTVNGPRTAINSVYSPGNLVFMAADSNPYPRFDFDFPSAPQGPSFGTKLKYIGGGVVSCLAVAGGVSLIRGH